MADLDTTSKRRSCVQLLRPPFTTPPGPDGTLDQGDVQHIALTYSGILASAPSGSFQAAWVHLVRVVGGGIP